MKKTRRLKSLAIVLIAAAVLVGIGYGLRALVLSQIRSSLGPSLNYGRIRLELLPPAVVIEDVRSVTSSPFFTAGRITIRFSFATLVRRDKSFRVLIEQPLLRIFESASAEPSAAAKRSFSLPFTIENGIIRNAEVHYYGRGVSLTARNVQAVFRGKKDAFTLRIESPENAVLVDGLSAPLEGKVTALLEGKGQNLTFRRIKVEGTGFFLKARGILSNLDDPQYEFQAGLAAPAELVAALLKAPFRWSGNVRAEGRLVRRGKSAALQADISSRDLSLHSIPLGRVEGTVSTAADGGRVDLLWHRETNVPESLGLVFGQGRLEGVLKGVHLDPVIRELNIPWPVSSPAWGGFTLENKRLEAHAEFRDEPVMSQPNRFPFKGSVDLTWDGATAVGFRSERLESTFGTVGVEGELDIGRSVRVLLNGDFTDVKQGREFTALVLQQPLPVPEIRGRGRAEIQILGNYRTPQVKADFALAPAGFDKFEAQAVSGTFELANKEFTGLFKVRDPDLRGDVEVKARPGDLTVRIRADAASLETVLPNVNINIPLTGRSSGDLTITQGESGLVVKGNFAASRANLLGQDLSGVSGKLDWSEAARTLAFSEMQGGLRGGTWKGAARLGFKDRRFELDLQAADLDLSSIYSGIRGRGSFNLKGEGDLDQDAAVGTFSFKDIRFASFEPMDASGELELRFVDEKPALKVSGALDPGRNDFSVSLTFPPPERSMLVNIKGRLLNPDLVLPWKGVQGEVTYLAEIKDEVSGTQVSGVVDFKGALMPFPGIAQALTNYSGLVFIQNNKATIRSLQGHLGGGSVSGGGEIRFGGRGIDLLDIQVQGKEMVLTLLERTRALADGSLRLLKDDSRFSLTGDFLIKSLSWKRELSEKFIFSQRPSLEPKPKRGFFDDLALNIRLRADDNAVLENSLGRIRGRFDLTLSGKAAAPVLLGDIEGLKGDVNFQDRSFRVLKARLSFFNPASIEPYIDFQGETFLRDYRVTFSLSGLVNRLRPEFASSPPLPPEDVLALLALGESFKRTYSYDTSSQLGTGSMLSFQLGEEAQKRAERLFSLDRFRIDPFVLGASSEMTARLTVGKKISRNIILLYSTNLTSQREEIVRLEWEFSDSFSLVGMRDERGRISFDAKVRKRF